MSRSSLLVFIFFKKNSFRVCGTLVTHHDTTYVKIINLPKLHWKREKKNENMLIKGVGVKQVISSPPR